MRSTVCNMLSLLHCAVYGEDSRSSSGELAKTPPPFAGSEPNEIIATKKNVDHHLTFATFRSLHQ